MGTTGSTASPTPTPDRPTPATDFLGWLEFKRSDRDLSWAEVSRRSGISENGLRRIRQGEVTPRPATIHALAKAVDGDDAAEFSGDVAGMLGTFIEAKVPLPGIPARRGSGDATTYLTVKIATPRGPLDRETAGRLILFLEATGRAWVATADCTESD